MNRLVAPRPDIGGSLPANAVGSLGTFSETPKRTYSRVALMPTLPTDGGVLETHLPMLWGAQDYLKSLLDDKAAGSLVAEAWEEFYRVYDDLVRRFVIAQGIPRCDANDIQFAT